jgi:hypothetical protein
MCRIDMALWPRTSEIRDRHTSQIQVCCVRRPPAGLLTVPDPCNRRVGNYRCYPLALPADSGSFTMIHISHYKPMRSEVLTVVKMSMSFLWVVTPRGGGTWCLYFQDSLFASESPQPNMLLCVHPSYQSLYQTRSSWNWFCLDVIYENLNIIQSQTILIKFHCPIMDASRLTWCREHKYQVCNEYNRKAF